MTPTQKKKLFRRWLVAEIDEMLKFGKGVDIDKKFVFNLKVKHDGKTTKVEKQFQNNNRIKN